MKKNIIFSLICGLIAFIIAFAMLCPNQDMEVLVTSSTPQDVCAPAEGMLLTTGEFLPDGTTTLESGSPVVVQFPIESSEPIKCIKIAYKEPSKNSLYFHVELTQDGSFTDIEPVLATISRGQDYCCVTTPAQKYIAARVWFWQDCTLKDVSVYSTEATITSAPIKIEVINYILVVVITLFITILAFFVDKKLKLSDTVIKYVKTNFLKINIFICGTGGAVVLGIVSELLFRVFAGSDSTGKNFNVASCACFSIVFIGLFVMFFARKQLAQKPEKLLFLMILTIGIFSITVQPMAHNCWDLDTHYVLAKENSYITTANYTGADMNIKFSRWIEGASSGLEKSELTKEMLNIADETVSMRTAIRRKVTHLPAGAFMAVSRFFGADFYTQYRSGQFANLLLYAIVTYFAVKKLKSGKMIACTIAMFPTNIFIASNYSYDHWVTAFLLLGTCYFVSECEQPGKTITAWETIVMCGAFALGSLPKQIYILLMALPIFMHKKWLDKKEKRRYYLILISCFAVVFAMLMLRSATAISAGAAGDTRGGEVNPSEQLKFILTSPFKYALILVRFLAEYLSYEGAKGYINNFAYLGLGKATVVFVIVLVFVMLTGKNGEKHRCSWWVRVLSILLYVGLAVLMATALYIDFTPVRSEVINGCQPRYIIPLLAPVALTLCGSGIKTFKNKAVYNGCILIVLYATVIFNFINQMAIPMM